MGKENEPIKSPFSNVKRIEKHTSKNELADSGAIEFAKMLRAFELTGKTAPQEALSIFGAGFMAGLKSSGFSRDDAATISTAVVQRIVEIGNDEDRSCFCGECGKK